MNVRFAVEAATKDDADALAESVVNNLAAWIDGSLGSPPWAPWITAWNDESAVPLPLTADQLANWSRISDPFEPFDLDSTQRPPK